MTTSRDYTITAEINGVTHALDVSFVPGTKDYPDAVTVLAHSAFDDADLSDYDREKLCELAREQYAAERLIEGDSCGCTDDAECLTHFRESIAAYYRARPGQFETDVARLTKRGAA